MGAGTVRGAMRYLSTSLYGVEIMGNFTVGRWGRYQYWRPPLGVFRERKVIARGARHWNRRGSLHGRHQIPNQRPIQGVKSVKQQPSLVSILQHHPEQPLDFNNILIHLLTPRYPPNLPHIRQRSLQQ